MGEEAAASKTRDRELLSEVQRSRDATQTWSVWLLEQIGHSHRSMVMIIRETNNLRIEFSERFAQHDTRLRVVEQTLKRHDEHLREFDQSIQGLQQEDAS